MSKIKLKGVKMKSIQFLEAFTSSFHFYFTFTKKCTQKLAVCLFVTQTSLLGQVHLLEFEAVF